MKIDFSGRSAVVATMHGKESVIAPIFAELGITVRVPQNFDTDVFGTFTRDRDRPSGQIETALCKAEASLALTGESLAIASEGSFFPHPYLPGIAYNREIVLCRDRRHDLTIWGESLSTDTNFHQRQVRSWEEVWEFASLVGFPAHGLVVMPDPQSPDGICKGLVDADDLRQAVTAALERSPTGTLHLETDMRALYNPTRLRNIARAAEDLARKLLSRCPSCDFPGFDVAERQPGLPCEGCGMPTPLIRLTIYRCQFCRFAREELFPDRLPTADPALCPYCNP